MLLKPDFLYGLPLLHKVKHHYIIQEGIWPESRFLEDSKFRELEKSLILILDKQK